MVSNMYDFLMDICKRPEPDETWQIYNWLQHFTPENIESELQGSGFEIDQMHGDLHGTPLEAKSDLLGIIARST
jgi:hypothetical protein